MEWAYGVTTVPSRRHTHLPHTLESLEKAGFGKPRLFVDGSKDTLGYEETFNLEVTVRFPKVRVFGNWLLSLLELYIRNPLADRYAIFQDDFITSLNLRDYLSAVQFPEKGYWNLYTFPVNQRIADNGGHQGFFPSNQLGKSAIALVFNREGVLTLLSSRHMMERPMDPDRGHLSVDGGIITAMRKEGWTEYCHNPSLVQHTGLFSSIEGKTAQHKLAETWPGSQFDLMTLLS